MFILSLCYFAIYNLPLKYNDRSSGLFVIEYTLPLYKTINYETELLVCYCTGIDSALYDLLFSPYIPLH